MMSDLLITLRQWAEAISPGGLWGYGGHTGLWHLYLDYDRLISYGNIEVRPEELMTLVRDAEEAPGLRARVAELEAALAETRQIAAQAQAAHKSEVVDDAN